MANEIRNFRAALAQNDRNKSLFTFLIIEIAVFALIASGLLAKTVDSDTIWGVGFVVITALLSVFLIYPWTALITFIILGLGWAASFVALGIYYHNGWFWFLGICAAIFSAVINYWGFTFLSDLVADDD